MQFDAVPLSALDDLANHLVQLGCKLETGSAQLCRDGVEIIEGHGQWL